MLFNTNSNELQSRRKRIDWSQYTVYIIFLGVLLIFTIIEGKEFATVTNLLNITRQTSMITVMAVAMTFVIAAGGIDLSISGITALSATMAADLLLITDSVILTVVTVLVFGCFVGYLNGVLTTGLRIPSFLATLGMQSIVKGIAMWVSGTKSVPIYNETFTSIFGFSDIAGVIPTLLIWSIVFIIAGNIALKKLPFGKKVLSVGGNATAARYTGIKVNKIITWTFVLTGFCAAFAGMLYAGRMQTGRYTFGEGVEMDVIAAVVLGGTSMAGGTGNIIGAFVGALLIGSINVGLIILGLSAAQQMLAKGIIIIVAVAIGNISSKRTR